MGGISGDGYPFSRFLHSRLEHRTMKKALVAIFSILALGSEVHAQRQIPQTTLHRRSYFYAGGKYVAQGNSSIMEGAIYVERLTPQRVTQPLPLLVVHGHGE
jgi:hypothetical protein